jgi:hypothetical protein
MRTGLTRQVKWLFWQTLGAQLKKSLIVRHHRPGLRRFYLAMGVLVLLMALVVTYWYGERRGGYLHFKAAAQLAQAGKALEKESSENARLRLRVSFLEHSIKLANQSATEVKKSLIKQQGQLNDLQRQLAFYRGIVAPPSADAAVRIAGLQVLPDGSSRAFRFQIVLIRADDKTKPPLHGSCTVTVSGERNGKTVRLSLASVSPNTPDPLKFTLRYFTNLSGALRLPHDFTPHEIDVSVDVKGKGTTRASFNWPTFSS